MARSRAYQEIYGSCEATIEANGKIDLLRSRMNLLNGKDLALMEMYLDNAGTFRRMARLAGVNEANIARRIHKIIRRLLDGQYITCLHNQNKFSDEELEISRDYFVDGLPMDEIADRHEISYYRVRKTMRKIQRLTSVPINPVKED